MSTSFPSFCPKISSSLWFTSGEHKGDEIDICFLESQYETMLKNIIEKDKDVKYIGKKTESENVNESEVEGEWGESGEEEEEEEELNEFQDSPEEQNSNMQVGMDSVSEDVDDNSWMI